MPTVNLRLPAVIFREYDIRGTVGDQLTPEAAYAVGKAFATLGAERLRREPQIAVGHDNRPSGVELVSRVVSGIEDAGGLAVYIGQVPTPALYFATHTLGVDGGLQVTGSHNPPEFNGFKMVLSGGPIYGQDIGLLRQMISEGRLHDRTGGYRRSHPNILSSYRDAIVERNTPLRRPVKVVVDCGNGVTSLIAIETLERLGAVVVPLFAESDGTFPNHHPDPTVLENLRDLQAAVVREKAEMGIGFDGDGDRIGVVDERGNPVFGDQLLVLFARDLVQRIGTGFPVIFDVKCSDVLPLELKRSGLEPVMWKTGHSLIKQKMLDLKAPLAGEMSGHMFFGADWFGFDDALFAAARLIHYVADHAGPLSPLLADLPPTIATPEIRVECADDLKVGIVAQAAQYFGAKYPVSTLDGVRISFKNGWGLVRASNTQPVLVMRFEAPSEAELAIYRNEVEDWLREAGVHV